MSDYKWVAKANYLGGFCIIDSLAGFIKAEGSVHLDWSLVPGRVFTIVCNSIEQGFLTAYDGKVPDFIKMLTSGPHPDFSGLGYVGKKDMNLLVPREKAETYKTDLIAAAHMMDVDLSKAVSTSGSSAAYYTSGASRRIMELTTFRVSGWDIPVPSNGPRRSCSRDGSHLKPMTSKFVDLFRQWTKETYPTRQAFHEWVQSKPPIGSGLYHQGRGE